MHQLQSKGQDKYSESGPMKEPWGHPRAATDFDSLPLIPDVCDITTNERLECNQMKMKTHKSLEPSSDFSCILSSREAPLWGFLIYLLYLPCVSGAYLTLSSMSLEEFLACLWSLAHRNVVLAHHAKENVSQSANLDNGRNWVLFLFILFSRL